MIKDAFVKVVYNFLLSETTICCHWDVLLSLKPVVIINGNKCTIEFYTLHCFVVMEVNIPQSSLQMRSNFVVYTKN